MTEEQKKEAMRRYREERAECNRKRTLNPSAKMPIFQPLTSRQIYEKYGRTETTCANGECIEETSPAVWSYETGTWKPFGKPEFNPYNLSIADFKTVMEADKVEIPKSVEYDIKWVQAGDFQLLERYNII